MKRLPKLALVLCSVALTIGTGSLLTHDILQPLKAIAAPDQIQPQPLDSDQELNGLYVYIDPGHGGTQNHARGRRYGTWEKDEVLQIGLTLRDILTQHGAQVYMSRTSDETVSLFDRVHAPIQGSRGGNDPRYDAAHATSANWRLLSLHLNATGSGQPPDFNQVEVMRKHMGYASESDQLGWNIVNQVKRVSNTWNGGSGYVGPWTNPPQPPPPFDSQHCYWQTDPNCDLTLVLSQPLGYNVLIEGGYLTNEDFEEQLVNGTLVADMANADYRALVDYWLVGYSGPHQTPNQAITDSYVSSYWNSINAGRDPGVPFDNGGGYYVHQWGNANTQEFSGATGNQVKGSILQPLSDETAPAFYVRDPLWTTYIQKNGPNNNGPGLPVGDEHSWPTVRRNGGRQYTYPKTVNFQRGAIIWNSYEGTTSVGYDQHALFIANCSADGIGDPTFGAYLQGMVRRFSLSNDLNSNQPPLYADAGIHVHDPADRAEADQALIWAESLDDYYGSNWPFADIQGYWARPWIRIGAEHLIANGYPCGGPGEPCNGNNDPYFRPNNHVTRGQFSKMESVARGWPLLNPTTTHYSPICSSTGYHSFQDVCNGSTFYQYIETVKSKNAIVGYPCGGPGEPCNGNTEAYFHPGNDVSRGQMSKIIDASLSADGVPPPIGSCW